MLSTVAITTGTRTTQDIVRLAITEAQGFFLLLSMDMDQHIDADQQSDFDSLFDEIDEEEPLRAGAIARGTVVDVSALAIPLNFTF